MKKIITWLIVLIVIVLGLYLIFNENSKNIKSDLNQSSTSTIASSSSSIVYNNTEYGFKFNLPKSWQGYSILNDIWQGYTNNDSGQVLIATNTEIILRNPNYSVATPTQDIPIMVFTKVQWEELLKGQEGDGSGGFYIGAAPIPPTKLGENSSFIFALPARYNYAFPTGYEEVDTIIKSNPLTTY